MDQQTRDRIIALERRRYRNRLIFCSLGILVAPLGVPLTAMAAHHAPLPPWLGAFAPLSALISLAAGLLIVAFGIGLNSPPRDAERADVVEQQIETIQNRHRNLLVLITAFPLFFAASLAVFPRAFPAFFGAPHASGTTKLFLALVVGALPVVLMGFHRSGRDTYHGILIEDELTRNFRLQSIRIGYAAVMLALTGAYIWFLWHPADVMDVLPWIMALGLAIPAWAFAILHWRAGRARDE